MLYDAKKGSLRYVNAGHDPLLYISRRERQTRVLEAEDPTPVGVARDILFLEEEIYLDPGDMLIGYSGGISDLIYKEGGFKPEFLNGLKDYLNQKPDQLVDEVFQDLLKFYPNKPGEEWSLLILKIME
jgi:serine phosphatase RsbU (regulator of sigma subunit)